MAKGTPVSNIRGYIIEARKKGYPDSAIVDNLEKSKWPSDIIEAALKEADKTVKANPENQTPIKEEKPQKQEQTKKQPEQKKEELQTPQEPKKEVPDDLFTKSPIEEKKKEEQPVKEKKKFCFWSLLALFLSWIPFIGLGVAMGALDDIKKNNKSGTILAVLALLINIGTIGLLLFIIFQFFTLDAQSLTGLSKYVNDLLNIV